MFSLLFVHFESRTAGEWLDYHHLLYFHTVAREGSVTQASAVLRLAQPTLLGQIRKLEGSLAEKRFVREGRNLALRPATTLWAAAALAVVAIATAARDGLLS